jgi:endonuclease/exonuclease/phosphatase family metal-dependent hydrolase
MEVYSMKNAMRLFLGLILVLALAAPAFAEEASAPAPAAASVAPAPAPGATLEAVPAASAPAEPAPAEPAPAESSTAEAGPAAPTAAGPVIKVLTFNTWGIVSAKYRPERAEAMGRKIAQLDPDIVAIEEMFESPHRQIFIDSLRAHGYQPAAIIYFRKLYGSGILFISKFPVYAAVFEPYRVNSAWYDVERLGGKGIAHLDLNTPYGRLDFFITHALSRSTPIFDPQGKFIPGDPLQVDRLVQMYQIDQFVRSHKSPWTRSIMVAGDFNVSPEMLEYQLLASITGFESSFELLNPGQNPSTFCHQTNMFVPDDFSRIDHIFFKNYEGREGFWLKPMLSRVEMTEKFKGPGGRELNYSDHYGIYTEFEVVTDPAAVKPSADGVVPDGALCQACARPGYADGKISLTPENAPAWRDYALAVLAETYARKDRDNPLVIPMAEVLVADPAASPTVVLDAKARAELEAYGCPRKCRPAELPSKPGDESLERKLQSFSPW